MFQKFLKIISTIVAGIFVGLLILPFVSFNTPGKVEQSPIPALTSIIVSAQGEYPAMVRLTNLDGQFFCSGTVVSENMVLTAAHCLNGMPLVVESLQNSEKKIIHTLAMPIMINPRADYGLITGDFKMFSKMRMQVDPAKDIFYFPSTYVACGNPWGSGPVCYPIVKPLKKFFDGFITDGQLYPGMSGGPVVDTKTGLIVAVNTAVTADGIIISPLIGLFESIGR